MVKRVDEEFAKEAFVRFLARVGGALGDWQDGSDPPDYFLSLPGHRFAVEVTQVMERFDLAVSPVPYAGMSKSLTRLTRRLQARALQEGVLRGTYVLAFKPIPNLGQQESVLTDRLLQLLSSGSQVKRDHWTPVLQGPDGPLVEIMKLTDNGATIAELVGGSGPKWGGQIVEEGSRLILEALTNKADRLRNVAGAHILLLVDAYHYAPGEIWRASIGGAASLRSSFHTIARVHAEYECQVLFSMEPAWEAAA